MRGSQFVLPNLPAGWDQVDYVSFSPQDSCAKRSSAVAVIFIFSRMRATIAADGAYTQMGLPGAEWHDHPL